MSVIKVCLIAQEQCLRMLKNSSQKMFLNMCSGTGVKGRRWSRATRAVVLPQDIDLALTHET